MIYYQASSLIEANQSNIILMCYVNCLGADVPVRYSVNQHHVKNKDIIHQKTIRLVNTMPLLLRCDKYKYMAFIEREGKYCRQYVIFY